MIQTIDNKFIEIVRDLESNKQSRVYFVGLSFLTISIALFL